MSNLSKKKLAKLASISPRAGDDIHKIIEQMVYRANTHEIRVTCVFNEAQFTVEPGMVALDAYELWKADMDRQGKQWRKSMKAEVSRREQKVREDRDVVRGENVRATLEADKLQVSLFKRSAFNKAVRVNSADGYSAAAVNFAIAWGVAMQQALRKGKKIADIAEELSHEVDYEGITGFQFGCAVSFLANFWKHGEELRRWHNLDTQLGNEGEEANKKKGATLNPALLSIGKK